MPLNIHQPLLREYINLRVLTQQNCWNGVMSASWWLWTSPMGPRGTCPRQRHQCQGSSHLDIWFLWNLYENPRVSHSNLFFSLKLKWVRTGRLVFKFWMMGKNNSSNLASLLKSFPWKHYQHDLTNSVFFQVDFAGVQKTANSILKRSQQRISRICGKRN